MEFFWRDFLYAFRILFKRPGPTVLAVLALSLSIGLTTTTFCVYNALFFKGLPYPKGESIYRIVGVRAPDAAEYAAVPVAVLDLVEREVPAAEALTGFYSGTLNLSGDGHRATRYDGAFISGQLTAITGVQLEMGQDFESLSPEAARSGILISHRVWRERYGGQSDIVGLEVRVNGAHMRVVGVLPPGFTFPHQADVWTLLDSPGSAIPVDKAEVVMAAGLAPGSSVAELRAQLEAIAPQVFGGSPFTTRFSVEPYGSLTLATPDNKFWIATQILAIGVILLIACANVANLLLGRAATRANEMAVRSALGATRFRLIRQLLTESLVLALLGCIGGLLYTAWSIHLDQGSSMLEGIPGWVNFELDWRVYGFTAAMMVLTALACGILPALQASRTELNDMLKETTRTATSFRVSRFTRILTVGQIALSCCLLFGAGLVARHVHRMGDIQPPFPPEAVLTLRLGLFESDYPDDAVRESFTERLLGEVSALPEVEAVGITTWISEFGNSSMAFRILPADPSDPLAESPIIHHSVEWVSPGYLAMMGADVLAGEALSAYPTGTDFIAMANESFARRYFNTPEAAIGRYGQEVTPHGTAGDEIYPPSRIIGITRDLPMTGSLKLGRPDPTIYLPLADGPPRFFTLVVRARDGDARSLVEPVRDVIHRLDPHLPPYFVRSMADFYERQLMPYRMFMSLFLFIATMALFLAAIGVYGLMSFSVSLRRQEFGVRMALGASRRNLARAVLRQGLLQLGIGVALGLGLVLTFGRLLRLVFADLNPVDVPVFLVVLGILTVSTLIALIVPIRRTARLSPLDALRYE